MTSSKRSPPGARPRKSRSLRVVVATPLPHEGVVFPGQGHRLFQLFRDDLMRRFGAPDVAPAQEKSHG